MTKTDCSHFDNDWSSSFLNKVVSTDLWYTYLTVRRALSWMRLKTLAMHLRCWAFGTAGSLYSWRAELSSSWGEWKALLLVSRQASTLGASTAKHQPSLLVMQLYSGAQEPNIRQHRWTELFLSCLLWTQHLSLQLPCSAGILATSDDQWPFL